MPPAFVLSQDQTLRKTNFILSENPIQALKLCCFLNYIEIQCLKMNFQGYIALFNFQSAATFLWRLIIYYQKLLLSSQFFDKFLRFFISLLFFSFGAAELQRSKTSYNIASKNCLSNWFSNFFRFFISSFCSAALSSQVAKRYLIYHRFYFCQINF